MESMLVGPPGGGKNSACNWYDTGHLQRLLSRVFIWPPSINVDSTWKPVKDYIRDHIKPSDREKCFFDSYEPNELEQLI